MVQVVPRGDSNRRIARAKFLSVCDCRRHAIVVTNATQDSRFAGNPYVITNPGVRFYAGFPLQTRNGHNVGTLCLVDVEPRVFDADQLEVMSDLAHMVMDELHLRRCADREVLTDALSRRAFKDAAERSIALAIRHQHPLSVISFDLDFFKHTNDTFGHAPGDRVLRGAVTICMRNLRASDMIGRLGGEEFSIVLPIPTKPELLIPPKVCGAQ